MVNLNQLTRAPKLISSRENPQYRQVIDLVGSSRERRRSGHAVIEGIHLCAAFLAQGGRPVQAWATAEAIEHAEVAPLWRRSGEHRYLISQPMFRELSRVETGVALVFVIETPTSTLPDRIEQTAVYLDRVQDPGNVGTILRCCAAAGVRHLLTSEATAFCWSPKVLRAAMGAHFALNICEGVSWQDVQPRLAIPVLALSAQSPDTVYEHDLRSPCLWLLGNEGAGLSSELLAAAHRQLSIPIEPAMESLNVAATAAVVLFEQRRQQTAAGTLKPST